jgi:hypothetical protein
VADDGALRRVDLVDRTVTTVAGRSGSPGYEDGSAVRARLGYLIHAIVVTPDGRTALLADRSNDVIRAVDLESYEIRTVSGTSAGWQGPGGLAFDPESSSPTEVWVADTFADRIRSIDIGSGTVTEIASVPSPQGLVLYDGAILAMGFEPSIMRIEPGTGRTPSRPRSRSTVRSSTRTSRAAASDSSHWARGPTRRSPARNDRAAMSTAARAKRASNSSPISQRRSMDTCCSSQTQATAHSGALASRRGNRPWSTR